MNGSDSGQQRPDSPSQRKCWICGMRGTQWPPLSWFLRWHLNRMRRLRTVIADNAEISISRLAGEWRAKRRNIG